MENIYFLLYVATCICIVVVDNNVKPPLILVAFFLGYLFGLKVDRNRRLKKQGLKIPSFCDDFKKDFNTLIVAFKKTINALKISFIWTSKAIFKGLKWLFKPEHIRLFFFLIKEGIFLLLHGAWLLVYYFFYFIAGIAGIIGLISGIIGFFGLF